MASTAEWRLLIMAEGKEPRSSKRMTDLIGQVLSAERSEERAGFSV